MITVREKRLTSDHAKVTDLVNSSGGALIIETTSGKPPHTYVIVYRCRGIERVNGDSPVYRDLHRVQIHLPAAYPSRAGPPVASLLTPIFHPHVWTNGVICLGRRWTPGEYLDSLILRIGAIIQYDPHYFDFQSPANPTAAAWTVRNIKLFPLGRCTFKAPPDASKEIVWTDMK